MAKKQLTIEEKLEAALVPVEEQPYKVPENWCWVRLGSISTNQYGYSAKAIYDSNYPRMLRITDIKEDGVDWKSVPNCVIDDETKEKYLLQTDDIVVARTGATTGKSYLLVNPDNAVFASYLIRLRITREVLPSYIYLFLQSSLYWNQITELAAGIAQPGVNSSKLLTLMVPLPKNAEQSRIVARIESLFAKLDEAKEKIQEVLDGADLRRTAILHQAFTGKLTEKWRRENGVSENTWNEVSLGDVIELLSGQDFKPVDYNDSSKGIPYITGASNFEDNGVIINRWTEKPTVIAQKEDVLLVCKGSGYGKTIIANFEQAHIARQIMALRVKNNIINTYLRYYLMAKYDEIRNNGQGLIPGISRKVVLGMRINEITISEQQEIVRLLDNLLSREQSTVTACEKALATIGVLKKSILARAFRGELGTGDPREASAKELLQEILAS